MNPKAPVQAVDFEAERQRLLAPFVQCSSEEARQVLESLGDLRSYLAHFSRDEVRILRIILGDLARRLLE